MMINIKLSILVLILSIYSCNNNEIIEGGDDTEEYGEEHDGQYYSTEDGEEVITEVIEEYVDSQEVDDIAMAVIYYNQYLSKVYPNRDLSVHNFTYDLSYDSYFAENIEGGGRSLQMFKVMENQANEVGVISFDVFEGRLYTDCIAILDKDNYLSSAHVINVNNEMVLRTYSNKSGLVSEGPYDINYFDFSGSCKNFSLLTQLGIVDNPVLSSDEIKLINQQLNFETPSYSYYATNCEFPDEGDNMTSSMQLDFSSNGSLSITQYQGYTANCYYRIEEEGKITIYFIDKYYNDYLSDEFYEIQTIDYNLNKDSDGNDLLNFPEGVKGFLPSGTICR